MPGPYIPAAFTVMITGALSCAVASLEFTAALAPVSIADCVLAPGGATEIALNPQIVMAYAVVPAEFTTIIRGLVFNRAAPKTPATGFSGTGPTSDTALAFLLASSGAKWHLEPSSQK